jgi:hypothetical protein
LKVTIEIPYKTMKVVREIKNSLYILEEIDKPTDEKALAYLLTKSVPDYYSRRNLNAAATRKMVTGFESDREKRKDITIANNLRKSSIEQQISEKEDFIKPNSDGKTN